MKFILTLSFISLVSVSSAVAQFTEYFFDQDPGFGNGIMLDNSLDEPFDGSIDLSGLDPGFHQLFIRIKVNGIWSTTQARRFFVEASSQSSQEVEEFEYFFDKDPGIGNGINIAFDQLIDQKYFDDTLNIYDLANGQHKFYLRAKSKSGLWNSAQLAEFLACDTDPPVARFDYILDGNSITILDSAKNVDTYQYTFGDEESSNVSIPRHTYISPGNYEVCQTVKNNCSDSTICHLVRVIGISGISPKVGGNDGNVTLKIHGGGLFPGSKVFLEMEGIKIYADTTVSFNDSEDVAGFFTFSNSSLGEYQVGVDLPDGETIYSSEGIKMELSRTPQIFARILGRNAVRQFRQSSFSVEYGNNGNTDAWNVPIWVIFIGDTNNISIETDFTYLNQEIDNPVFDSFLDSIPNYFNMDSIPTRNEVPFVELLAAPANGRISGLTNARVGYTYRTGKVYPIVIPFIPANSNGRLNFKLRSSSNTPIEIVTYAFPPLVEGTLSYSGIRIATNFNSLDCWTTILEIAIDKGLIPGVQCAKSVVKGIYNITSNGIDLFNSIEDRDILNGVGAVGNMAHSVAAAAFRCAGDVTPLGKTVSIIKGMTIVISDFKRGVKFGEDCLLEPEDVNEDKREIQVVSSVDPNEKNGPLNFIGSNYFKDEKDFVYTIFFENLDTATAAAQEVFITDTLDHNQYDFHTFSLSSFGFSGQRFKIPSGLSSYSKDIDLRPKLDLIVRFNAKFDTLTGVAKWYFGSLDPNTMELTDDPFLGFLPPNDDESSGEGFVSFNIEVIEELPHASKVENYAAIVFDLNEAILTPTWINIKDIISPTSQMNETGIFTTTEDSLELAWSGVDDGSGIAFYDLFLSKNESEFNRALNQVITNRALLQLNEEGEYKVFIVAYDSTGNVEQKSEAELTIVKAAVTSIEQSELDDNLIYPNPSNQYVNIRIDKINQYKVIKVYSINGKQVLEQNIDLKDENTIELDISRLDAGIYLVNLAGNESITSTHKLYIKK